MPMIRTAGEPATEGGAPGRPAQRALAVFHDRGSGFWVRLFTRPGFRHCFVALDDGRAWIALDARRDGLHVETVAPAAFDLAAFYRRQGCRVVETQAAAARRRYRLPAPVTCVEVARRCLGLPGCRVWTPYGLYRVLRRETA